MMPEWCPPWAWEMATQLCEDLAFHYDAECIEMTARALLEAHQRGRREGMEEAASLLERLRSWIEDEVGAELPFTEAEQDSFEAIRAKMEDQP